MNGTWRVGVLAAGAESVRSLAEGIEPTAAEAVRAATNALVEAARSAGRQEYRIEVGRTQIMVLPGLDGKDDVDLAALRHALRHLVT